MKVTEMEYGMTYDVSEVTNPKALYNKCPCCGRPIADHFTVTVAFAPEKGAQGYKAVVGADCAPEVEIPDGADTLTLRVRGKNRASVLADLAWATKEMTRTIDVSETTSRDPKTGRFLGYTATVTVLVPEKVNGLGKLGKVAQRISTEPVEQSLDGGETWGALDTTVYAKVFGCGKYQGRKVYGV